MPHFVMDCSNTILEQCEEKSVMQQIHRAAVSSDLFIESEIKVRINPSKSYLVGNEHEDFIHIFAHIMEGRTYEQKERLSKLIVCQLAALFPHIKNVAMNISDFAKHGYCNRYDI